jgi:hypothetical protein
MEFSLPASVNYAQKVPEMPDTASSTLMAISPNNGLSFTPGQIITFDLPSRNDLYIDGKSLFIRYKVSYTSGATAGVVRRKPVYTNFSRLDEFIGGTPVNSVFQYNQVANMWVDLNCNIADIYGQQYSYGLIQTAALTDLDGMTLATVSAANTYYLSAPLVCSFLQGSDKLYPTGASAPIRIQLTIDSIDNIAAASANITAITISQPELCFSAISMPGVDRLAFSQSPQLFLKTRCWANSTQGAASATSGQQSLTFNHRYSSIENFYFLSSSSAVAKAVNLWGDSFNALGIDTTAGTIQLTVGQTQVPQLPISNLTGGRASVQTYLRECTGQISDQRNTMSILNVNFNQYAGDATVSTVDAPAKFIVGFPVSRINAPSPYVQTSLLSGLSAQQSPVQILLNAGTAFNSAMVFYLIAEYSAIIVLDPMTKQVSLIN